MTGEMLHRLEIGCAVLAGLLWAFFSASRRRDERRARARIAALLAAERVRPPRNWAMYGAWARRWGVPLGALLACYVLVGGVIGALVGLIAGGGARYWQRRRPAAPAGVGERDQLPLAADLLAACVTAGAGPREAAEAVGESLGGPVGERLAHTAAELRLGGEPAEVWRRFGGIPGAESLARCLERAGSSGAPAAEPVARIAAELRAAHAREAATRAQRAQVLITAPVGLCFLPAFLAIGVAPGVIGLADGLMRG
ncbi:type II secretion system F family protein [Streptomyces purpureus]|uniref:Membrane protein n=1 Tax=Streptomyces purpureus TaxID=1951 RepID=A0A918H4W1_9ACTN|nr:type II secretion system F family protein [Streptomyces purpureus]GGT38325.1 membrane protein [Streptomyces purpureus]